MRLQLSSKKRKAITRDSPEADKVVLSDGEDNFEAALFNNIQSKSDDDLGDDDAGISSDPISSESDFITDEEFEDVGSDEVPSEGEDRAADGDEQNGIKIGYAAVQDRSLNESGMDENYTITKDANGNTRYVYRDIDTVYDSDDSEAPATTNTIGNVSFNSGVPFNIL